MEADFCDIIFLNISDKTNGPGMIWMISLQMVSYSLSCQFKSNWHVNQTLQAFAHHNYMNIITSHNHIEPRDQRPQHWLKGIPWGRSEDNRYGGPGIPLRNTWNCSSCRHGNSWWILYRLFVPETIYSSQLNLLKCLTWTLQSEIHTKHLILFASGEARWFSRSLPNPEQHSYCRSQC